MEFAFAGEAFEWRGPAPHVFVRMPEPDAALLAENLGALSYGWGCIPAVVTIGDTTVTTSLMPKDGGYVVPLKVALRRPEGIEAGDVVTLRVAVEARTP